MDPSSKILFFEKFFENLCFFLFRNSEISSHAFDILDGYFFGDQPKTGHLQILPSPKSIILVKNRMFLENYF